MKNIILGILFSAALIGCSDKQEPTAKPAPEKQIMGNVSAGKAIAERDCKACHGLDGKGVAPGIPHLAAQRERYLLASIKEYKEGKRTHAALKDMMGQMKDADAANVVAYYASLPPIVNAAASDIRHSSVYEEGKALAASCTKCHGEDGNSRTPGTPSLAGQQPHYLVAAIQEYHQGERKTALMQPMSAAATKLQLEKLALYFAAQTPVERPAPSFGDPAAGEPLSAMCGGCHGAHGVSSDATTPSLAGQDPQYLVKSIKAYRTTRQHWGMQRYVAGLSDKDMENIAAFYVVQKPRAADQVPSSTKELAAQCNRCHDVENNPAMVAPKMNGQDKDYLVMSLRSYRDGKRQSSTMHNMSTIYSNAIIESIATWYAGQPAK
ncbi:MAG: cytochrome c4 [Betaproteobacteria bacterium]|nr:cytochrome c4 [Betaproteobacteria bacterium]